MKNRARIIRGNTMVVVLLTATAVATIAFAGVAITGSVSNNQSKSERGLEARYVIEGAAQCATSDVAAGILTLGTSKTYYIGGNAVTVVATDNSSVLANSLKLSITGASGGVPLATSKTVSYLPPVINNIWSYGIYSNSGCSFPTGTKVVGSVYVRSIPLLVGTGVQVTKDFKTSSTFNPLSLISIGGAILTGIASFTYPTPLASSYSGIASSVLVGDQTLNGYTFPVTNAVVVVNGNLTLHGQIQGQGTFYVTGDVLIDGQVTLGTGGHFLVVTPNNITFNQTGSTTITASGYYFAGKTVTANDIVQLTGAIVGNNFVPYQKFQISWDPWLTTNLKTGADMHAPQMWP